MFRIEEHKSKAPSWLGGFGNSNVIDRESLMGKEVPLIVKEKEDKGIMSQIPQMYLDNSSTTYIENIDPFFLSLIINGKTLKNFMIDSGALDTVMPFKIMESLSLKVDTNQGKCRAMDA